MNKLKENKLSITMKEALARNSLAENKMKASVNAISTDSKKSLQNLEFYKQKYEKRQRELQNEKQRMLHWGSGDERKISAPACMVTVVDVSTGELITDSQRVSSATSRERSLSMSAKLPSLLGDVIGRKSPDSVGNTKQGGLTLPVIGPQRRYSATILTGTPSSGLIVPTMQANDGQTRSAPSSPCAIRRKLARPSSAKNSILKTPPSRELDGILSLLDKVREKQVPDLEEAMALLREQRWLEQKRSAEETAEKEEKLVKKSGASPDEAPDDPSSRKISIPGTAFTSTPVVSEQPAKNSCDVTTLEESFHKVKFCKYLRTPSLPDEEEKLPDELIPKSLIVGHTQWLPGDSRATHRN